MARFYVLTEEQIKTGKRPKTPRQKMILWRMAFIVLTSVVLIEHLTYFYLKYK